MRARRRVEHGFLVYRENATREQRCRRGARRDALGAWESLPDFVRGRHRQFAKTGWSAADPSEQDSSQAEETSKSGRRRMGEAKHQLPPRAGLHARRAGPRESHDSPYPPVASRRVRSPSSNVKNKNAESRTHHPNSWPPRRPTTALGSPGDPSHGRPSTSRRLRRRNDTKTEPVNAAIIV